MKQVRIVRLEESAEGALGVLLIDKKIFCITLEPDAADPVRYQVPASDYICKRFHGNKFKDTFEILVPGHSAILFHPGNIEEHTTACVILGRYAGFLRGNRAVLNSGWTFKEFMKTLNEEDKFNLSVTNGYRSINC